VFVRGGFQPYWTRFRDSIVYFDVPDIVPRWGSFTHVPDTQMPQDLCSGFTLVSRQLSCGEGDSVIPPWIAETDPHSSSRIGQWSLHRVTWTRRTAVAVCPVCRSQVNGEMRSFTIKVKEIRVFTRRSSYVLLGWQAPSKPLTHLGVIHRYQQPGIANEVIGFGPGGSHPTTPAVSYTPEGAKALSVGAGTLVLINLQGLLNTTAVRFTSWSLLSLPD
jgi:hypothetical protein